MNYYKNIVSLGPKEAPVAEFLMTFISETHYKVVDTFFMDYLVDCSTYTIKHAIVMSNHLYFREDGTLFRKNNKRLGVKCPLPSIKFLSVYTIHNVLSDSNEKYDKNVDVVFAFPTAVDLTTLNAYMTPSLGKLLIGVKHYKRERPDEAWKQVILTPTKLSN